MAWPPSSKYVLKETAILFEHNYDIDVDLSVLVIAPLKVRIERIIKKIIFQKIKLRK